MYWYHNNLEVTLLHITLMMDTIELLTLMLLIRLKGQYPQYNECMYPLHAGCDSMLWARMFKDYITDVIQLRSSVWKNENKFKSAYQPWKWKKTSCGERTRCTYFC